VNIVVPPTSYHRYKDVVFPTAFVTELRTVDPQSVPITATFRTLITGFTSAIERLYQRFYDWRYRRWLQAGCLLWTAYYISRFVAFFRQGPEEASTWSFALLAMWWLILLGLSFTRLPLRFLHLLTMPAFPLTAWTVVQVNYEPWLAGHYDSSVPQILGPFVIVCLTFGLPFRLASSATIAQIIVMVGACLLYSIPLRPELLVTIAMALTALLFFNAIQELQARSGFLNRLTIYNLVTTDGLTGIANRSYFAERLGEALQAGTPTALIVFDVDRFKQVNDTYGHAAGDTSLRTIGRILAQAAGDKGVAGRLGGEEFALFLSDMDQEQATAIAKEIGSTIRTTLIPRDHGSFRVTVSGGVVMAIPPHSLSAEQMFQRGDDLMYQAKDEGRNRIVQGS
jgi:diguanylate cyclase (GGDEF)-like protein